VMASLARVVCNRQGAVDPHNNHRENNQQRDLHGDLATAGPPNLPRRSNYRGSNEPTVNAPSPEGVKIGRRSGVKFEHDDVIAVGFATRECSITSSPHAIELMGGLP